MELAGSKVMDDLPGARFALEKKSDSILLSSLSFIGVLFGVRGKRIKIT